MAKGNGVLKTLAVLGFFAIGIAYWGTNGAKAEDSAPRAKNVILMIGDGMGFNEDLAGTYWRFGEQGKQIYYHFPKRLACSTFCIVKDDYDPAKVKGYNPDTFWQGMGGDLATMTEQTSTTDSAAAATAINSGTKTQPKRIGMDFNAKPLKTYAQYAAEAGRSVGIVTTVDIPNATPAGVMAHFPRRSMLQGIAAELILGQPTTVVIGGGHPFYHNGKRIDKDPELCDYSKVGGKYVFDALQKNDGFADALFIDDRADFEKIAEAVPGSGRELPKRLIGVTKADDLPPVDGFDDEEGSRLFDKVFPETDRGAIPTLSTLSWAALNTLAQNQNGFYLMIEGGAIDHGGHKEDIEMTVLHHEGFTKAVEAVCEWIETYSCWDETLLIVTADHETGQLWGPETYVDANGNGLYDEGETDNGLKPIVNNGRGHIPGGQYGSDFHTNALVPFWAKGVGADFVDSFVRGRDAKAGEFWRFSGDYIDNTDITPLMKKASGIGLEKEKK